MKDSLISRRRFLHSLAIAAPATSLFIVNESLAQDLPKLSLGDPLAIGLQYVEDATASKAPTYKAGQDCANCLQILGEDGDDFRPCAIMPGKLVASKGWCTAWVAKP
ncbi:MAG: high-potential iron-sulfur protein [Pseudomonadota bacterium]|nr:high-potential iron-sulfur protein [Pseudomonadota bacterium]